MTDFFALLGQPRQPWLDPGELKARFHELARVAHPDAGQQTDSVFRDLSEAYETLADPKRRLHHLLTLAGAPPPGGAGPVPPDLGSIFSRLGTTLMETQQHLRQKAAVTSPLGRSVLAGTEAALRSRLSGLKEELSRAEDDALQNLKKENEAAALRPAVLGPLYQRLSYLSRWRDQVEEQLYGLDS